MYRLVMPAKRIKKKDLVLRCPFFFFQNEVFHQKSLADLVLNKLTDRSTVWGMSAKVIIKLWPLFEGIYHL